MAYTALTSKVAGDVFTEAMWTNLKDNFDATRGDGSASAPSHTFDLDTNTGLYRIGNDRLGVTTAGTKALEVAADGKLLFGDATDTNLYRSAADTLKTDDALVVGGALKLGTNTFNLRVPPAVRLTRSTTQTIGNTTIAAINFNAETYDTDTMASAGGTTLTITTAGLYLVTAGVSFAASGTGDRFIFLAANPTLSGSGDSTTITASTRLSGSAAPGLPTASLQHPLSTSAVYAFSANDTIALGVYQTSGGNLATSTVEATTLTATWLGQTS